MNSKVRWGSARRCEYRRQASDTGDATRESGLRSRRLLHETWRKQIRQLDRFGIPRAYGSYEELLADDDIEVIYNLCLITLHVP